MESLNSQVSQYTKNAGPVTQIASLTCLILSLIGMVMNNDRGIVTFIAMVPGYVLPPTFFIWTLLTNGLFETALFNLVGNLICFFIVGQYLENLWGSKEFLKFIICIQLATSSALLIILVFCFSLSKADFLLYEMDVHGMACLLSSFLVVFKQHFPESSFPIGPITLRAKDIPAIVLLLYITLYIIGLARFTEPLSCVFGIYFSWIYLRFFQVRDGVKGDRSETFQFASFFPQTLRPIALALSRVCFRFLVALKMCDRIVPNDEEKVQIPPTSTDPDSERRRNLAKAALEARIEQKGTLEQTKSQNLLDDESDK